MTYISAENKITIPDGITFDDVLLLPDYANFLRDDVDLEQNLHSKIRLNLPVLSSPMDTVTMAEMAISLAKRGGLGIIHRNLSVQDQAAEVAKVKTAGGGENRPAVVDEHGKLLVGAAVGIGPDLEERVQALVRAGADLLVIDSAHGHTKGIIEAIKTVKKLCDVPIMAGNITTAEAAKDLIEAGCDMLRVGMGPGSICTTRIVTGMGVPQLTAISEVARVAKPKKVPIIADGGIKQIGDIAKALAFGADCVMLGSMLAGFDESPGDLIEISQIHEDGTANLKKYKSYRGMGSIGAMVKGSAARYGQGNLPAKMVAEGVEGLVKYKGAVEDFLFQIEGGLRSSFYYTGCQNLTQFYNKTKFVKITAAGVKESHPHSISITQSGASYL